MNASDADGTDSEATGKDVENADGRDGAAGGGTRPDCGTTTGDASTVGCVGVGAGAGVGCIEVGAGVSVEADVTDC